MIWDWWPVLRLDVPFGVAGYQHFELDFTPLSQVFDIAAPVVAVGLLLGVVMLLWRIVRNPDRGGTDG